MSANRGRKGQTELRTETLERASTSLGTSSAALRTVEHLAIDLFEGSA